MLFQVSIGSKGQDHESYSLHIPLIFNSGREIKLTDNRFKFNIDGYTYTIEKHYYLYSLKVETFQSRIECENFLKKIIAALKWLSLKQNIGISLPKELKNPGFFKKAATMTPSNDMYRVTSTVGWDTVDGYYNVDELVVVPEDKKLTRWETGKATFTLQQNPERFSSDIEACLGFPHLGALLEEKRLMVAIDLYSSYSFEVTSVGKFIKLVSVLESLLPNQKVSKDEIKIVEKSKKLVKEYMSYFETDSNEWESANNLLNRVGNLKNQSIGYNLREFISSMLEKYPKLVSHGVSVNEVKDIYTVRSNLLHTGDFIEAELKSYIEKLNGFIRDLLETLFVSYATSKS